MAILRPLVIGVTVLGLAASGAAQPGDGIHVSWAPDPPSQGSFVLLTVRLDSARGPVARAIRGTLAGQPLRFEPAGDGRFQAIGGIPIGAAGSIPLTLVVERDRGEEVHRFARLPVVRGEFRIERLTVAPRFVEPLDSATAHRVEEERRAGRAVSQRSLTAPRLWRGRFAPPADGRITSTYGTGREFNGTLQSRHWGVDFSGDTGTPVRAPNRGVVALVGDFYYAGNIVYLDHGAGVVSALMHLSEVLVAEGDTVVAGQVIGKVGASGRVTGPHLHWTTRYGSVNVNGLSLLELDLSGFGEVDGATAPASR